MKCSICRQEYFRVEIPGGAGGWCPGCIADSYERDIAKFELNKMESRRRQDE